MDFIDRMLGYTRFQTERILELCGTLGAAQWDEEFDIGHRTLRATWNHTIAAINYWSMLMSGERAEMDDTNYPLDDLPARHRAALDRFERVVRQVLAEEKIDDLFLDQWSIEQSYGGTILNVITHSHAHRGEVLHMLQRLGVEHLPDGDPQEWEWIRRNRRG